MLEGDSGWRETAGFGWRNGLIQHRSGSDDLHQHLQRTAVTPAENAGIEIEPIDPARYRLKILCKRVSAEIAART